MRTLGARITVLVLCVGSWACGKAKTTTSSSSSGGSSVGSTGTSTGAATSGSTSGSASTATSSGSSSGAGTSGASTSSTGSTGSASSTGTTTGGGGDRAGLTAHAAATLCTYLVRCGQVDPMATNCPTLELGDFQPDLLGDLDAGLLTFDLDAGTQAVAALEVLAADGGCATTDMGTAFTAFNTVASQLQPNVPLGGACRAWDECIPLPDAGYSTCKPSGAGCAGTCVATFSGAVGDSCTVLACLNSFCDPDTNLCKAYQAIGEACEYSTAPCDPAEAYCDTTAGSPICVALGQDGGGCNPDLLSCQGSLICNSGFSPSICQPAGGQGAPCGYSSDCQSTLYCALGGADGGTCAPLGATGAACSSDETCASELCFGGSCSDPVATLGQACGTDGFEVLSCGPDQYCDLQDGGEGQCVTGTDAGQPCSPLDAYLRCPLQTCFQGQCASGQSPDGAPCGTDADGDVNTCEYASYCDNPDGGVGVCKPLGLLGDPCRASDELSGTCANGYVCVGGQCVAAPGEGEGCDAGWQCRGGLTCASFTCLPLLLDGQACDPSADACAYSHCSADAGLCLPLGPGGACDLTDIYQNSGCGSHGRCESAEDGGAACSFTCGPTL